MISMLLSSFQSTLPYGSDNANIMPVKSAPAFQSTLPYGSDFLCFSLHVHCSISIHAPLRERHLLLWHALILLLFQSTLPYGSDFDDVQDFICVAISIHAPLRERQSMHAFPATCSEFQSTLPYGSDSTRTPTKLKAGAFQSTLPYGSDVPSLSGCRQCQNFNPRSLTGATC